MVYSHFYRLYGLLVASDLSLPELVAMKSGQPDIVFKYADVPRNGLEKGQRLGPFHSAAPGKLWLHVPNIARYLVLDGREVWIDPMPGVDEASLRVFLQSTCIAALLMQRGLLVLHGCAIRVGKGCFLCLGNTGTGKSTLAVTLMRRGYAILSDDVVAIDHETRVIPGFPDIKLWQDAAEKLGIQTAGLLRTRPNLEKFHLPLGDFFQKCPLPVHRIYVLQQHDLPVFQFRNVAGVERFACLHEHSYRSFYLQSMGLQAGHMRNCATFAASVPIQYLRRPRHPFRAEELADLILADIGALA